MRAMVETSHAGGSELVDDAGREFRLKWSTDEIRRAAREVKRGARVGVLMAWSVPGGVEWPSWTASPPRHLTERAEMWLTDVVRRVGDKVEFSMWEGSEGSVLLA